MLYAPSALTQSDNSQMRADVRVCGHGSNRLCPSSREDRERLKSAVADRNRPLAQHGARQSSPAAPAKARLGGTKAMSGFDLLLGLIASDRLNWSKQPGRCAALGTQCAPGNPAPSLCDRLAPS